MTESGIFDAVAARNALTPPITRSEMARRIGISHTFLAGLERGTHKWPAKRKALFEEVCSTWNQQQHVRKPRSDKGGKHRKPRKRPKAKKPAAHPHPLPEIQRHAEPFPVFAHPHGEIVGIG